MKAYLLGVAWKSQSLELALSHSILKPVAREATMMGEGTMWPGLGCVSVFRFLPL